MTTPGQSLQVPQGEFRLCCYPPESDPRRQAWNSADLLLLNEASRRDVSGRQVLVVNDAHGALSVALPAADSWGDSWLAFHAAQLNHQRNGGRLQGNAIPATRLPAGDYRLVLVQVPKQLALLRWQLQSLRELLAEGAVIICGGMDKHLPRGLAELLETFIGPTQRHRGERRARLFTSTVDKRCTGTEPEWQGYVCEVVNAELAALPNVFCRDRLDPGTRYLLENMPAMPRGLRVADLGCGNGVLGLAMLASGTSAVTFVDESAMAVASAQRNLQQLSAQGHDCFFQWGDGLLECPPGSLDLVVCNPPFHQQHAVDDRMARRLIAQAASALSPSGELWLVANRHLGYGRSLSRHFTNVEQLPGNSRFNIWRADRPSRA